MMLYVFNQDGSCAEKRPGPLTIGLEAALRKNHGQDCIISEWAEDPYPFETDKGIFTAEF